MIYFGHQPHLKFVDSRLDGTPRIELCTCWLSWHQLTQMLQKPICSTPGFRDRGACFPLTSGRRSWSLRLLSGGRTPCHGERPRQRSVVALAADHDEVINTISSSQMFTVYMFRPSTKHILKWKWHPVPQAYYAATIWGSTSDSGEPPGAKNKPGLLLILALRL